MPVSTTKSMEILSKFRAVQSLMFVYMLVIVQVLAGNVSYASYFLFNFS